MQNLKNLVRNIKHIWSNITYKSGISFPQNHRDLNKQMINLGPPSILKLNDQVSPFKIEIKHETRTNFFIHTQDHVIKNFFTILLKNKILSQTLLQIF